MYVCACPCGARDTIFRRVNERDCDLPSHCGERMQRIIVAPAVQADLEPYESPKTGRWIGSRAAQREDLLRSGSFLLEPGVREDIARNKRAAEAASDRFVEHCVNETIRDLSACGRLE
jgi:hypothetical protein